MAAGPPPAPERTRRQDDFRQSIHDRLHALRLRLLTGRLDRTLVTGVMDDLLPSTLRHREHIRATGAGVLS